MSSMLRRAGFAVPLLLAACGSQETGRWDLVTFSPTTSFNQTSVGSIEGAAGGGNASSSRLLGDMYYWGDLVEPDRAKAVENWTVAAQGGDALGVERMDAHANGRPIKVVTGGGGLRACLNQMGDSVFDGLDESEE